MQLIAPLYVVWETTLDCNAQCIHCYSDAILGRSPEDRYWPTADALRLIDGGDGLEGNGVAVELFGQPQLAADAVRLVQRDVIDVHRVAGHTYRLKMQLTKAVDYGIVQLYLDGKKLGVDFIDINMIQVFKEAGITWVDGMTPMMEARAVKNQDEQECFRQVGAIGERIHQDIYLASVWVAALEAAQKEGGDIRGKQSAAILVVSGTITNVQGKPLKEVTLHFTVNGRDLHLEEEVTTSKAGRYEAELRSEEGEPRLEHEAGGEEQGDGSHGGLYGGAAERFRNGHARNTKPRPAFRRTGLRRGGWRRSTLPPTSVGSTIDAAGLNCRVRDGNGCFLSAIAAEIL